MAGEYIIHLLIGQLISAITTSICRVNTSCSWQFPLLLTISNIISYPLTEFHGKRDDKLRAGREGGLTEHRAPM